MLTYILFVVIASYKYPDDAPIALSSFSSPHSTVEACEAAGAKVYSAVKGNNAKVRVTYVCAPQSSR